MADSRHNIDFDAAKSLIDAVSSRYEVQAGVFTHIDAVMHLSQVVEQMVGRYIDHSEAKESLLTITMPRSQADLLAWLCSEVSLHIRALRESENENYTELVALSNMFYEPAHKSAA